MKTRSAAMVIIVGYAVAAGVLALSCAVLGPIVEA
jgi:hypothetical protein